MVITWCLLIEDLEISGNLVLINLEEEIRLSLHVTIYVLSKSLSLLTLKLLLKVKGVQFLLYEGGDSALDFLEMFVVVLLDFSNLGIDSFFLLRRAQLGEPFGLSRRLLALLFVVSL